MRIVHLPLFWTLVADCLAWTVIQMGVAYLSMRFPPSLLDPRHWLFRPRRWERSGAIYQDLFRVRRWKGRLPSGGVLFKGFSMVQVQSRDSAYLQRWVTETCRAELCHWVAILPAFLFFLWNPFWVGVVMVAYAIVFNAPPIITQRYNRPRLMALLCQRERPGEPAARPLKVQG